MPTTGRQSGDEKCLRLSHLVKQRGSLPRLNPCCKPSRKGCRAEKWIEFTNFANHGGPLVVLRSWSPCRLGQRLECRFHKVVDQGLILIG